MMETSTRPDLAAASADADPAATVPAQQAGAITKIVVAIHGIGQQYRSETIRAVARRFGDDCQNAIPLLPLGYFSIPDGSEVRWSQLETSDPALSGIGFAELFWADIPDQLVRSNDTLEETKAWAHTVVSRAERLYQDKVKGVRKDKARLGDCDFQQGIDAIDTLAEGVAVLERLSQLASKAGAPAFEVGTLLRDFVGDVQTVTEFPHYRNKILYRFHTSLNAIVAAFRKRHGRDPEIHLVAHSEGTVVSLLALLQALSSMTLLDPDGSGKSTDGAWVEHVHGFMTLGSPIDKHIALWPGLWKDFAFTTTVAAGSPTVSSTRPGAKAVTLRQRIKWRNYFDFGDPVGFRLDEARSMLVRMRCGAFEFDQSRHDHGYSRYWLPGKAHIDYWQDAELFRHFIETVVKSEPGKPEPVVAPPPSKRLCGRVATSVPYVLSLGLHLAAMLALLAALDTVPFEKLSQLLGAAGTAAPLALLLASITVAARLPRLVRPGVRWFILAAVCVGLASIALFAWLPDWLAAETGAAWVTLFGPLIKDAATTGKAGLCIAAAVIGAAAWLIPRRHAPRGRRLLVACGMAFSIAMVMAGRGSVTAVSLGELAACIPFVLLWWLGIIVFDLAFVWHRYIREALYVRTLRSWQHNEDVEQGPWLGLGTAKDQKPAPIPQPL